MGEHRRKADANNLAGDDEILHLRSRFTTDRARLVERAAHHNPRRFVSGVDVGAGRLIDVASAGGTPEASRSRILSASLSSWHIALVPDLLQARHQALECLQVC